MAHRFHADSDGPPEAAWSLLAEPSRWHEWAPHVRGAWGLGSPEVQDRRIGAARLLGVVPVPAQVVAVAPGRWWTWRVGPALMVHAVEPRPGGGCRVSVTLSAPGPLDGLLAALYGPVVQLTVDRLARRAGCG
jgi:hypothetical protein